MHLPIRTEHSWKLSELEGIAYLESQHTNNKITSKEKDIMLEEITGKVPPPKHIKPVPRFYSCLRALHNFFSLDVPPVVHVRSKLVHMLAYGFLDASGSGFGRTIQKDNGISYRMGTWAPDDYNESSNWKEFQNLVETLEIESQDGGLRGALVILAVDNSLVESSIYKCNSSSPKLFNLILRFKHMELHSGARFIVSHVSGNRTKHQGTDGVSRGNLKEGVSIGHSMLSFCPWHLSAIERSNG